jgi:2-hydroxychromene-2-carboxylate isomerase
MAADRLQLWFEFASTYSYPAVCRAPELARAAGLTLEWRPFLLGPIFQAQGWNDSPFNLYPAKGRYMWRDLERICEKHGLPFRRPSRFPRGSLLAARIAGLVIGEPWCTEFVRAVYHANFVEDREIGGREVVGQILETVGQPAAPLLDRAESPESKARLRAATDEGAALGIFGAPTFVVDGELFWGHDRLEDAIAWCRRRN